MGTAHDKKAAHLVGANEHKVRLMMRDTRRKLPRGEIREATDLANQQARLLYNPISAMEQPDARLPNAKSFSTRAADSQAMRLAGIPWNNITAPTG